MHSARLFLLAGAFVATAAAQLVPQVRSAIARNDLAAAERLVSEHRAAHGVTPEMLEGLSWLGRGSLAAKSLDAAEKYAAETRKLALEELKKRPLDQERRLPIALGASIEVQGHVLAERGARSEAVAFLQEELKRWWDTSIRTRIQKNIHLLSLTGEPAPELDLSEWIGNSRVSRQQFHGRPVVLFFWAHWCGDCKYQVPILQRILEKNESSGLLLVAPTQRYGYIAGGQEATQSQEEKYIASVLDQHYRGLGGVPVPLSEENFRRFGASTTPTLILIDRQGRVRLYHPGRMDYERLEPLVAEILKK